MQLQDTQAAAAASAAGAPAFSLTPPHAPAGMRVTKRNGTREAVDLNKIVRAVTRAAEGLHAVEPLPVALKTIGGLYDGASTRELDELSIRTAAALTAEEPEYGLLAARLLAQVIAKEVRGQDIQAFSQAIARGAQVGLINARVHDFVVAHARKLDDAVDDAATQRFEYFGLRTLYDRYLLRHPQTRAVLETPQYFFMRIACALGGDEIGEILQSYRALAALDYLPSSPTLFNAGTCHEQMSSCYLLDSPSDSLEAIYARYGDVAKLSKFAGGIGLSYTRIRAQGSLIRGTNGKSNGVVPWLKTLDASVAAVNQGGKRKGACCVYLEPWHADIEDFLELRDNTGDAARRTYNLNLANWIPDLFMRRVEQDAAWTLFDPKDVPELPDLWGEDFERAYVAAEARGLGKRQLPARALYTRMLKTLAETGNGWFTFKDRSNATCNQAARPGNVVHLSNLCTEILEVGHEDETAVCNLASINLARHVDGGGVDFEKLAATVRLAVRQLDRVIDRNYYPIEGARRSNARWRPVGLVLTDFGIATIADTAAVTQTAGVMGSPAYLAPERLASSPASPAGDLWSLGATLYQAATGVSPFQREGIPATLHAVLNSEPPGVLPGPLGRAIQGMLVKDPARRLDEAGCRALLEAAAQGAEHGGDNGPRPATGPQAGTAALGAGTPPPGTRPPQPYGPPPPRVGHQQAGPPFSTPTTPVAGAGTMPVAPQSPRRLSWPVVVLTLGLASLVVAASLVVFNPWSEQDIVSAGTDTSEEEADDEPTQAEEPQASPSTPVVETDAEGDPTAPGMTWTQDPEGFSILVPDGWVRRVEGDSVFYDSHTDNSYLQVDSTTHPTDDQYQHVLDQEDVSGGAERFPGYERVRVEDVTDVTDFHSAADWEFVWSQNGVSRHLLARNVTVTSGDYYTVLFAAEESRWTRQGDLRENAITSFDPL